MLLCSHVFLGILYFFFSVLSGVFATIHMKRSKSHVYEAIDDGEMAELNTPYIGDKYGATGDPSPGSDTEQKKTDTDL